VRVGVLGRSAGVLVVGRTLGVRLAGFRVVGRFVLGLIWLGRLTPGLVVTGRLVVGLFVVGRLGDGLLALGGLAFGAREGCVPRTDPVEFRLTVLFDPMLGREPDGGLALGRDWLEGRDVTERLLGLLLRAG